MPPERHDDVEDVVWRARGDVAPEETHELSALVALVEKNTARCHDSFEVGQVHLYVPWQLGPWPPGVEEAPHVEVCVSRRGDA